VVTRLRRIKAALNAADEEGPRRWRAVLKLDVEETTRGSGAAGLIVDRPEGITQPVFFTRDGGAT